VHAGLTFLQVTSNVLKSGLAELPGYFDVLDELNFSHFISMSLGAFEKIVTTKGSDMDNLFSSIGFQEMYFSKMRPPLLIKSVLIVIGLLTEHMKHIRQLPSAIKRTNPIQLVKKLPGLPALLGRAIASPFRRRSALSATVWINRDKRKYIRLNVTAIQALWISDGLCCSSQTSACSPHSGFAN